MTCMCGDLYCGSCGPAQGNFKCSACGQWSEDGGCVEPEKCDVICKQIADNEAKYFEEMAKHEKDYNNSYETKEIE